MNAFICILHKLPARCSAASQINTKYPDQGVKAFLLTPLFRNVKYNLTLIHSVYPIFQYNPLCSGNMHYRFQIYIRDYLWFEGENITQFYYLWKVEVK